MLLQPSGNEIQPYTYAFNVEEISQVGEIRRFASGLCESRGFEQIRQARAGIVINELGNNLVKYALNGEILLRAVQRDGVSGVEILAMDRGPGSEKFEDWLRDGHTSGSTPGTGLGAVRRQSDDFDIYSVPGKGTVIVSIILSRELTHSDKKSGFVYAGISVPMKSETSCGDGWSIRDEAQGCSAFMVDGLGHGPLAHEVAERAVRTFETAPIHPVSQTLQQIHESLKGTRGGAVFMIRISATKIEFGGIGNIRSIVYLPDKIKGLISQNGTAGLQMRKAPSLFQEWDGEGCLILHSDGITSRWDFKDYPGLQSRHPALIAGIIYRDFSRNSDDASVLIIRKREWR